MPIFLYNATISVKMIGDAPYFIAVFLVWKDFIASSRIILNHIDRYRSAQATLSAYRHLGFCAVFAAAPCVRAPVTHQFMYDNRIIHM